MSPTIRIRGAALAAVIALSACSLSTDVTPAVDPVNDVWAAALAVDFAGMTKTLTGLWIKDTEVGTGKAVAANDSVEVTYGAYLHNGFQFSQNITSGIVLAVRAGKGILIPGVDQGLIGIKEGGKRRLIIPFELGYGAEGARDGGGALIVGPNANLLFDVYVTKVIP